uniref:Uncharacterized protein n=1 Tax=Latimeria chalumnae TaxID=7897 RepID=H3ARX3_LATCH
AHQKLQSLGGGGFDSEMAEAEISNIPEYETVELNTKVFHVGSFANKWRETLEEGDLSLEEDEKLATVEEEDAKVAKEMGISEETAAELRLVCSVDTLRCAGDDNPNVIPDDTDLVTLGSLTH